MAQQISTPSFSGKTRNTNTLNFDIKLFLSDSLFENLFSPANHFFYFSITLVG